MSFTVQNVIDAAGGFAAGLTISAPNGLAWTQRAVILLMGQRTDANYDSDGNFIDVPTLATVNDAVPIDDGFQDNLARYVASRQFSTDAESGKHREQAIEQLKLSGIRESL
jgi:hypothetical protein